MLFDELGPNSHPRLVKAKRNVEAVVTRLDCIVQRYLRMGFTDTANHLIVARFRNLKISHRILAYFTR